MTIDEKTQRALVRLKEAAYATSNDYDPKELKNAARQLVRVLEKN